MNRHSLADSLWAATGQPGPQTESLSERVKVDVAIIGAGFNGLRAALVLGKNKQDLPISISEFNKYPFHRFHRIGIKIAVGWKEFLDKRETAATR
jgi:hypothetical protein